ncbi:MAG: HD domain-containing protein [Syntrophales bacterium]|nr:HD domain-containing protein [Syntrophales bacterium]
MEAAAKKESVLVVEADPQARSILTEMVSSFGFQTTAAINKAEALEILEGRRFGMVIADIESMEDLCLIREVRQIITDVPFVVVTGYSKRFSYENVVTAGGNDFIKKPFTELELRNKLHRILYERRLASENKRLLENQITINKKITSLLNVALNLTAEVDFDRLFQLIVSQVTKVMNAERTSLYLIDWDKNEIWTTVAEQIRQFRLPIGEGISGLVAKTGEIINVPDAWELPYFKRDFDLHQNFRTKSVLCMPIYSRDGERIAVIQVLNRVGGGVFGDDDVILLRSLASQIAIALENSKLVEELKLSFESSIRTLSATVDAKHKLTAGHSERVTEYALMIARQLDLSANDLEVIKYAGLLHDIGKVGVRDAILLKCGPFNPEERVEMEAHTVKTKEILENFRFARTLATVPYIAVHHHERIDGKGYPDKLRGDEIPLCSKILAVADVFDALTSRRDYPKYIETETMGYSPMPMTKVLEILNGGRGTQFETQAVSAFLNCVDGALLKYCGEHFPPAYVDEAIELLHNSQS